MSRFEPPPSALRSRGLLALATITALGFAATRLPAVFEPATTRWTATIPVSEGARGLDPGGRVEIGGHPLGRILEVGVRHDLTDSRGLPLVAIDFELPSTVVLGRDAVIRRSVGIAGTNGVLDITDPGSRRLAFAADEARLVPIDLSPLPGGSAGTLLGRRQGEVIEEISRRATALGPALQDRASETRSDLDRLLAAIADLRIEIDRTERDGRREIGILTRRIAAIGERFVSLAPLFQTIGADWARLLREVEAELAVDRPTIEAVNAGIRAVQGDLDRVAGWIDELAPRLAAGRRDLDAAIRDTEAVSTRIRLIAPEATEGLARVRARLVLAGGQLSRTTANLLPIALEAILVRPDASSASRRRLFESVSSVVRAGTSIRDASRRLAVSAGDGTSRSEASAEFDRAAVADLEERLAEFEGLLDALQTRLREEIEADLDP